MEVAAKGGQIDNRKETNITTEQQQQIQYTDTDNKKINKKCLSMLIIILSLLNYSI